VQQSKSNNHRIDQNIPDMPGSKYPGSSRGIFYGAAWSGTVRTQHFGGAGLPETCSVCRLTTFLLPLYHMAAIGDLLFHFTVGYAHMARYHQLQRLDCGSATIAVPFLDFWALINVNFNFFAVFCTVF